MKAKLITVLFLIGLVNIQPMLQGMSDPGAVDAIVSHCPHLKILDLYASPEAVAGLVTDLVDLREGGHSQLEQLYLSNSNATADQVGIILSHCSNLKILDLIGCPISGDELVAALAALSEEQRQRFERLYLYRTGVTE